MKEYKFLGYVRKNGNTIVKCRIQCIKTGEIREVDAAQVKKVISLVDGLSLTKDGRFMVVDDKLSKYIQSCSTLGIAPLAIEKMNDKYIITDIPNGVNTIQIPEFADGIRVVKLFNGRNNKDIMYADSSINQLLPYIDKIDKGQVEVLNKLNKVCNDNSKFSNRQIQVIGNILDKIGSKIDGVANSQEAIALKISNMTANIDKTLEIVSDDNDRKQLEYIRNWIDTDGRKLVELANSTSDAANQIVLNIEKHEKEAKYNKSFSGYSPKDLKGVQFICDDSMWAFKNEESWNKLAETLSTESMDENGVYKTDINLFDYDAATKLEYRLQTKLRYLDSTRQALGEYYASEQSTALNKSFDYNGGAFNTILTALGLGTITEKVTSKANAKDDHKNPILDSTLAKTLSSIGNSKLFTGALLAGFICKAGVTALKWGYSKSCGFIAKSEIKRSRRALMDEMRQANPELLGLCDTIGEDVVRFVFEESLVKLAADEDKLPITYRYRVDSEKNGGKLIAFLDSINGSVSFRKYEDLMKLLDFILSNENTNQKILDIIIAAWLVSDEYIDSHPITNLELKYIIRYIIICNALIIHGMSYNGLRKTVAKRMRLKQKYETNMGCIASKVNVVKKHDQNKFIADWLKTTTVVE